MSVIVAGIKPIGLRVIDELPPDLARCPGRHRFFATRPVVCELLNVCRAARVPIVIGTTGHGAEFEARVAAASRDIAVLVAPNTSIGVAVAQELVRIAAQPHCRREFDIEIVEAHHKHKLDAPSGTALALADSAARARGLDPNADTLAGRSGQGARRERRNRHRQPAGGGYRRVPIPCCSPGTGERLTIGHEATDRAIFALGAIRAATWLATQKPGRYTMANVLGLKTIG